MKPTRAGPRGGRHHPRIPRTEMKRLGAVRRGTHFADRSRIALGRSCGLDRMVLARRVAIARPVNSSYVKYIWSQTAQALYESQSCDPVQNEAIVACPIPCTDSVQAPAHGLPPAEPLLRFEAKSLWREHADCTAQGSDPNVSWASCPCGRLHPVRGRLRIEAKSLRHDRADCDGRHRTGHSRDSGVPRPTVGRSTKPHGMPALRSSCAGGRSDGVAPGTRLRWRNECARHRWNRST